MQEKSRCASLQAGLKLAEESKYRLEASVKNTFSFDLIKEKEALLKFCTGADLCAIKCILSIVGQSSKESCRHTVIDTEKFVGLSLRGQKRILPPEDELLLTLMKLRHDFPEEDLGMRFGIDQTTISRIFYFLA